jgi:Fe-S-cluster containining protein
MPGTGLDAATAAAAAWARVRERFPHYEAVLPGSASFVCLASSCPSHCCKVYSVSLGDEEVARMERASGLAREAFLEVADGQVITLPLAQPFVLARRDGACALLADDLLCGQYAGRPNACRLYPHFVIVADVARGSVAGLSREVTRTLCQRLLAGSLDGPLVPVLLRHLDCPGFGGPAHSEASWRVLFDETARLQYPLDGEW